MIEYFYDNQALSFLYSFASSDESSKYRFYYNNNNVIVLIYNENGNQEVIDKFEDVYLQKSVLNLTKANSDLPYLGAAYEMLSPETAKDYNIEIEEGALIIRNDDSGELAIVLGSPADRGGLLDNDIILEINNQKLDKNNTLLKAINQYKPGDEVILKVWSKGEIKQVAIILGKRVN